MKSRFTSVLLKPLQSYLFIAVVGIIAFAPVSFMFRSLKNDIVALDLPINYFISQCIHNGEVPYWFNTWAMGFPLQSNLASGFFNTAQMIFCSVFNYNIFTLHIEFMFFVLLSGWGMFYLLKKHFLKDERIAVILACCYMLSGFIVGSGQWMLFVTATAFIPLVLSSLLQLLKFPSFRHALLFAVLYFIMFTSVYAAVNIITTYSLFIFIVWHILSESLERRKKIVQIRYIILAGILTTLMCLPCILSTIEVLKYINRGNPISDRIDFFNSNYLHPYGLSTMLFPFSSIKMSFPNTEGTMLHTYTGLFTLLILPVAILKTIKERNRQAIIILLSAIFFLLISFGPLLPLRKALNILPGFSYFRHPAIFRLYFIFFLIIYLAIVFRNILWENIFDLKNSPHSRILKCWFLILLVLCLIGLLMNFNSAKTFPLTSIAQLIKNISFSQSIFISAAIQLLFLLAIFYTSFLKQHLLAKLLFAAELIINTLLCTPYFAVSSYSLPEVNAIFHSEKGFPLQYEKINDVMTTYIDENSNRWNNVNVFNKKASANRTYSGPLVLENFSRYAHDSTTVKELFNHALVFSDDDTSEKNNRINLIIQRPTHIRVEVNEPEPTTITAMQNYFPGWKAYYNNKYVAFTETDKPGLTIAVPKGTGTVDFIYSKKNVWIPALLLHLFTISFLFFYMFGKWKRHIRSSFLSLPFQQLHPSVALRKDVKYH